MQTKLDDFKATELSADIRAILNDGSLDEEEKIIALMELPDPTMDEARAEKILKEHQKRGRAA